ncbi:hypothetical protein [Flavonifractor plautii]|nr:hypothetical protein [Flavonifractor plautii]QIA32015.1 hypothetical protein GXM20_16320 [Flavonifractor plautii]
MLAEGFNDDGGKTMREILFKAKRLDNGDINGKQKYIGAYRTLADAVKARDIAEGSIHDGEGGND